MVNVRRAQPIVFLRFEWRSSPGLIRLDLPAGSKSPSPSMFSFLFQSLTMPLNSHIASTKREATLSLDGTAAEPAVREEAAA